MTTNFDALLKVAREYCRTIESIGEGNQNWLSHIFQLLPQLHACIAVHANKDGKNGQHMDANLETRFELFSKLRNILGENDAYWMEYDVALDDDHKSGSLADDLTDIYCELKHGLLQLDKHADPERILGHWRSGYRFHWGRHLVDAERHLYELSAKNRLAS